MRAGGDEIVPANHLGPDEPARDVAVDRLGGVERRFTLVQRPRARLLVARGEEGDQVERLDQTAHNGAERGLTFPKRGRFLVGQLGELGLELEIDPTRPVDDLHDRLDRQQLELRRDLDVGPQLAHRLEVLEMRRQLLEVLHLGAKLRVARLRLLRHTLEPALNVIPVGGEQLERQLLGVAARVPRPRPSVEHRQHQVDLAQVPEQLCAGSRNVDDAHGGRRDLLRADGLGELTKPVVGHGRHPDVVAARRLGTRQRAEERRLAGVRQPHDPDLERH